MRRTEEIPGIEPIESLIFDRVTALRQGSSILKFILRKMIRDDGGFTARFDVDYVNGDNLVNKLLIILNEKQVDYQFQYYNKDILCIMGSCDHTNLEKLIDSINMVDQCFLNADSISEIYSFFPNQVQQEPSVSRRNSVLNTF